MFKSKAFECSTGTIGAVDPLDLTHDKIQDLKAEENFIARLKKQKQKMELLNNQFQQQDTLISEQQNLIKTLTASNNQLKISLQESSQKIQILEMESVEKSEIIQTMEATIQKLTSQFKRVSEVYRFQKNLAKENEQKLLEQENSFFKNYDALKHSTKTLQKQSSVLKQKYQQKMDESKELIKSLQLAEKTIVKLQQRGKKMELQNETMLQKYEETLDQTSKQLNDLKIQNQSLKNKMSIQTRQLSQSKNSLTSVSKQVQELSAVCEQRESKIFKLQDHLRNTLDQIKILQDDLNNRDYLIYDLSHKKQSNSKYRALKKELMHIRDKQATELDEMIESVRQRHF